MNVIVDACYYVGMYYVKLHALPHSVLAAVHHTHQTSESQRRKLVRAQMIEVFLLNALLGPRLILGARRGRRGGGAEIGN